MSLIKKFELQFDELLKSTFELAECRKLNLVLYIGYWGNTNQVDVILEVIQKYRGAYKNHYY